MSKTIKYYTPVESLKNNAKTALVMIDWFKKHFRLPIDNEKFQKSLFEDEEYIATVPQLKWIVYNDIGVMDSDGKWIEVKLAGVVESILIEKQEDWEVIHILLRPLK